MGPVTDSIWVSPVVSGAEVETPPTTCPDCSALMVRLAVCGMHDDGVAVLPSILLCPDCFDVQQVVAAWRAKVQGRA